MIPLEWVNVVLAEKLQQGDFALLLDQAQEPVLVGQLDQRVLAAFPSDMEGTAAYVDNLGGQALVIRDWEIEVDYTRSQRIEHLDVKVGSILLSRGRLAITCSRGRGHGLLELPFRNCDFHGPEKIGFSAWRIIKMNGNEKVVLYERVPVKATEKK